MSLSWRKLLLLAALLLLTVGSAACTQRAHAAPEAAEARTVASQDEPAGAETTEEAAIESTDTAVDAAAKETALAVGYTTYVSVMPAASGGGMRVMALRLYDDGTLTWDTQFFNDEPPIREVGTWKDLGDGTLTTTVTGRVDRTYDEPNEIVFQKTDEGLLAIEYDRSMYGSEGLTLRSVIDIAAGVETSLFTLDLAAGFPLDPTFMSVNAGGAVPADLLGPDCVGYVNVEPVVRLHWTGESDFLRVFLASNDDPTLVVLTPDGQAVCNDDANGRLLDPVVDIPNPTNGTYQIWAGSYDEGNLLPGVLVLTTKSEVNVGTFSLAAYIQRPQMPEALPEPGTITTREDLIETLTTALAESPTLTDSDLPTSVPIVAEGDLPLFQLPLEERGCAGLVTTAPSYTFNWTGAADSLRVMFEGDLDSSLLVIGPDMEVACADDSPDASNQNPVIDLPGAATGLYAVYVGRLSPAAPVTGTLSVTDLTDEPEVLAPSE